MPARHGSVDAFLRLRRRFCKILTRRNLIDAGFLASLVGAQSERDLGYDLAIHALSLRDRAFTLAGRNYDHLQRAARYLFLTEADALLPSPYAAAHVREAQWIQCAPGASCSGS